LPGPPADKNGIYRYIADGPHPELPEIDYVLAPNAPLERAIRLEDWLPEFRTNWDIMNDFQFNDEELDIANKFNQKHGPFVAFFMASLASNTTSGHNRNGLWTPQEWVELGERLHKKYGVQIVVVGTTWDEDYFIKCIKPLIKNKPFWHNYLSRWPIAQTYAILNKARFLISYQSGIGIVSHYLGKPVAIFWRPKGDSISPNSYVSFEEGMATAWARPDFLAANKLMPCIYGRHKIDDILQFAETHGW
jgi:ADP-heptose:LPS heptosyltransferase